MLTNMSTPTEEIDWMFNITDDDVTMTFLNMSQSDIIELLAEMDRRFALTILVAILFLALFMTIGVVGNLLVVIVYATKFKESTTRTFVLGLAFLDLLSCSVAIPGEIVDMRHNFTYHEVALCKLMRMINTFCSIGSGTVLLAVAVDRYKKICRPLQIQITSREAKKAVGWSCFAALLVTWPAPVLYGPRTVSTDFPYVNGTDCSTEDKFLRTPYPLMYNGVLFLVFFSSSITLGVLYSLIWCQVSRHRTFRSSVSDAKVQQSGIRFRLRKSGSSSGSYPTASTSDGADPPSNEVFEANGDRKNSIGVGPIVNVKGSNGQASRKTSFPSNQRSSFASIRKSSSVSVPNSELKRRPTQRDAAAKKTTFMLFLITLVFVLSYLPHLALMAARAVNKDMMDNLEGAAMAAYNLFLRSYFIQSMANPIIYGFCNEQFRNECKLLFKRVFCRK